MSAQGYPGAGTAPKQLERQMDMIRDKPAERLSAYGRAENDASARSVPGYYYDTNTSKDMAMKYRFAAANGGEALPPAVAEELGLDPGRPGMPKDAVPGALLKDFKVQLTPQDIEWLEERRRTKEQIEFDDWLTQRVDISNPAENRWLQEKYPEFWSRRERYIDDKINIEARLAKMRARGVNSIEDYKLLFALQKGYITAASSPLWFGSTAGGTRYRKGWLSLARETGTTRNGMDALSNLVKGQNETFLADPLTSMRGGSLLQR
jgi:hypothetical protein